MLASVNCCALVAGVVVLRGVLGKRGAESSSSSSDTRRRRDDEDVAVVDMFVDDAGLILLVTEQQRSKGHLGHNGTDELHDV